MLETLRAQENGMSSDINEPDGSKRNERSEAGADDVPAGSRKRNKQTKQAAKQRSKAGSAASAVVVISDEECDFKPNAKHAKR